MGERVIIRSVLTTRTTNDGWWVHISVEGRELVNVHRMKRRGEGRALALINWCAIGSVRPGHAADMAQALTFAVTIAQYLDGRDDG